MAYEDIAEFMSQKLHFAGLVSMVAQSSAGEDSEP